MAFPHAISLFWREPISSWKILHVPFDILQIPYTAGESIHDDYEHFIFRDLISYLTLMEGNWDKECFLRILNRRSDG